MTDRVHPVALVRDASAEDYDFGRDHPLAPVRVTLTHALIEDTGLAAAPGIVRVTPEVEPERDLRDTLRVHDADYVATVHDLSRAIEPGTRFLDAPADLRARAATVGLGAGDTPAFAGVHDASLAVVRASAAAAPPCRRLSSSHGLTWRTPERRIWSSSSRRRLLLRRRRRLESSRAVVTALLPSPP